VTLKLPNTAVTLKVKDGTTITKYDNGVSAREGISGGGGGGGEAVQLVSRYSPNRSDYRFSL
jgi:hypothetical protein